jgi:hypothetical protein
LIEVNANATLTLTIALRDAVSQQCGGLPPKEALALPCIGLPQQLEEF